MELRDYVITFSNTLIWHSNLPNGSKASEEFELIAPAPLNLVCFAHKKGNDFNRNLLETINNLGKMYFTHTIINGRYTLRMCIGQTKTEAKHVRQAWEIIQETAKELSSKEIALGIIKNMFNNNF